MGGYSSSRCAGLSLSWPLLSRSTGSRRAGSVVVAHGSSRSAACGIFPDQGSNPCALHWQADSQPLCHQGSPAVFNKNNSGLSEARGEFACALQCRGAPPSRELSVSAQIVIGSLTHALQNGAFIRLLWENGGARLEVGP